MVKTLLYSLELFPVKSDCREPAADRTSSPLHAHGAHWRRTPSFRVVSITHAQSREGGSRFAKEGHLKYYEAVVARDLSRLTRSRGHDQREGSPQRISLSQILIGIAALTTHLFGGMLTRDSLLQLLRYSFSEVL
jgi:hypothetical protein